MWNRSCSWLLGLGLGLGWGILGLQRASFAAQHERALLRSAKLYGEISLSPLEPVIGTLVEVGEGDTCCQTLPEQETWPSTEFEIDLEEREGYRFHSIGVFVEPQDGAKDAFYALFPTQGIRFEDGEASFAFERGLRPVEVHMGMGFWGKSLTIEARSTIQDLSFVSHKEWDLADFSDPSTFVIWVPEGVDQELIIRTSQLEPDKDFVNIWDIESTTRFLGKEQDRITIRGVRRVMVDVSVSVDGASSPWIKGEIAAHGGDPLARRSYSFQDSPSRLSIRFSDSESYWIQPSFVFEDGSSTTLATQEHRLSRKSGSRKVDIRAQLTPTQVSALVDASFDLNKLRISVAQGTGVDDAGATKEVETSEPEGLLGQRKASATLQLPQGDWQLSGLSVRQKNSLWTSNYLSWSGEAESLSPPAQDSMDFGPVARLVGLPLVMGLEEHKRTDHYSWYRVYHDSSFKWRLRGTSVEPGQDLRGRYVDRVYLQETWDEAWGRAGRRVRGELIGRAGHRYRIVTEDTSGEQVKAPFEVTLGWPQKVRSTPLAFVGTASVRDGRCNGLEIMYDGIASEGSFILTRLPLAPTPPRGYLIWPEAGASNRSYDIRRDLDVEPGSTARVCVQYDEGSLAEAGLSPEELTLAHPLSHTDDDRGCDPSNRYLGRGWCGMSKVEPQEMVFLLGAKQGCAWHCGLAKANAMSQVALLRAHPSQKPEVHCQDRDYYAHGEDGWAPVPAPERLAAAFEEGKRLGREATKRALHHTDVTVVEKLDALHRVFHDFFERAFADVSSDPLDVCHLRGQATGHANGMTGL